MAAFQFTVQQVNFTSETLPDESSSVDSLSSVVDPNIDFIVEKNYPLHAKDNQSLINFTEEAKYNNSIAKCNDENKLKSKDSSTCLTTLNSLKEESYPSIPLAVAHYINKNNPDLFEEAGKYLNFEALEMATTADDNKNVTPSSPLHSMSVASEALALQQSVIGNFGVKPVSADVVAEVVANTKHRLKQGKPTLMPLENSSEKQFNSVPQNFQQDSFSKLELIRYPSDIISSTVEKRSWFSISSTEISSENTAKCAQNSVKEDLLSSRSNNQGSNINSVGKKDNTVISNIPKVHSSKKSKFIKNSINDNVNSPYEIYSDSCAEYETESSVSEKFEAESLYSETFETESNFSEVSGIDDEIFQMRKKSSSKVLNEEEKVIHNGTQVAVLTSHANTSPFKSENCFIMTADKSVETEEFYHFQLLREKANLEGRLESVSQGQIDLVKERDHFRSLANSFETQIKLLEKQLDSANAEKKNVLKLRDSQDREQKSWDNVIKEYQSVIESKNNEIKGLKEDLSQSEQQNTHLKIGYEELRVEMESKEGAIAGLKKKIAELHVEIQVHLQGKIQLENEVKNVRLEMETLQKSKDWFQEQLHSTQDNRNKLHQELIMLQSNQVATSNDLEKVITEKNQLRQELIRTQECAVAEKEVLMKHLETIEADMKERESLFDDIQKDKGTAETILVERIRKLEEEKSHSTNISLSLSDQEYQIKMLKIDCEEKAKLIETLKNEKVESSRQIAILQKSFNDKDMKNEQLMQQIKDLNVKIKHLEISHVSSEELINTLKEERTATDVALASANEEKRIVKESVKLLSENLNTFKHNFKKMKADLVTKASQVEQLLKEKVTLQEALKKSEESIFNLRNEFDQQVRSENQNRDVMFDDLKKRKSDVENVLSVYSKDLLNYQQVVENLSKEKTDLLNQIASFKVLVDSEKHEVNCLTEENILLKKKISELEEHEQHLTNQMLEKSETLKDVSNPNNPKTQMLLHTKKVLYRKLKEKIKECDHLKNELRSKSEVIQSTQDMNTLCEPHPDLLTSQKTIQDLKEQLQELQNLRDEQMIMLKRNENIIIELEREKGKAIGFAEKYENLKQHLSELESKLEEKDSELVQLTSEVKLLRHQLLELDSSSKTQLSNYESNLNKERALIKNLRQQIFQEKRTNSHLHRDISSMKSALEQANQIADSKKQEIENLQAELSVKMQAELKHRSEIEHFQTEIRLQQSIAEKLMKELEEVKARDPALAEQIKALSWKLKEKTNEVTAFKEKLRLSEERNKLEIENFRKSLEVAKAEIETIKDELKITREEKFSYQTNVIELRKALKSKLSELESKGILRIDKQNAENGPTIHLNIPDPEVSFDETYVNSLLAKSMHLAESRPLNNLQECLNSLKEEMMQLQKKIIESSESS